ncbi:hypothetical protein KUTeg_010021 [Tegillarca granosa]|uniref:C2H2-type domain-containing protein n=1 Tax=Tegillarca granosa TaxID=220873 RepID=A0ABQ9F5J8_TEGGR|nr:hypothetical protein KUTeg_010021 [Tegillarca granosa]
MDSSEAVVIYLSDSPTSVSNVLPQNVTSGMVNAFTKNSTTTSNVTSMPIGQQPFSNTVASNKQQGKPVLKVPISRPPLKVPTYTASMNAKTTAPQVKNIQNYPPNYSAPVLLIPVTMPTNVMNVGLPQSPGATVNIAQRMVTTGNTYLASTPLQQGTPAGVRTVTGVPARGPLSVISHPSVPTSPLAAPARFQGGQFINIGAAVQQPTVVNPSIIDNSQGTRLIILPEGAHNIQGAPNQVVGITNVVAGPQPVLNSTTVPIVGQTNVTRSLQPLTTITTSAPPPSYVETILNKQNQLTTGNWTSILKQPTHLVQNNTHVSSLQQTMSTSNTVSTSSLQLPTSISQTVPVVAKKTPTQTLAPNKVTVPTYNVPIFPKPNLNDKSNNHGILATSMVTTGEKKYGGGNKLFFRKSGGRFTCDFCHSDFDLEEKFREHIWKHFHELQRLCKTCPVRPYGSSSRCTLVERVLTGLQCAAAAAAKTNNDTEKKPTQTNEPESLTTLKTSVDKVSENNLDKSESEIGKQDKKDVENQDESTDDKGDENGSGLQLKITSIVSLHQSKKSGNEVETEMDKRDLNDTNEVNEKVQQLEKSKEETQKKYLDHEMGNIFEKFSEEIRAVHGTPKKRTDDSSKTVTPEPSDSVVATPVVSDTVTSGSENITSVSNNENNTTYTSSQKPLPGYEFGGSFYVCGFRECSFRCLTSPEFRDHLVNFHSNATEFLCAHCWTQELH